MEILEGVAIKEKTQEIFDFSSLEIQHFPYCYFISGDELRTWSCARDEMDRDNGCSTDSGSWVNENDFVRVFIH